jgi:hypothetical protein
VVQCKALGSTPITAPPLPPTTQRNPTVESRLPNLFFFLRYKNIKRKLFERESAEEGKEKLESDGGVNMIKIYTHTKMS